MIKKYMFAFLLFQFFIIYAQTSFNSAAAIQKSNDITSEHWQNYQNSVSRYYGRVWLKNYAEHNHIGNLTFREDYIQELTNNDLEKVRMDCTIYCAKLLKAGMDADKYSQLIKYHKEIWGNDGLAGWSVAHLLVDKFNWKAYAFIEPEANLSGHYLSHFKNRNEYPVYNQPNIKIEAYYTLGIDDVKIEELLKKHNFSWGFSQDGIHTWITHYTDLLECHWDGAPAAKYNTSGWLPDLFETTQFIKYKDYDVHIIIVPPKED